MSSGSPRGLRSTTTATPKAIMLTPTVTELPRALESVGRDTFLAGADNLAAAVAPTRIGLTPARRAAVDATVALAHSLAA
jgi:hypothetical protein